MPQKKLNIDKLNVGVYFGALEFDQKARLDSLITVVTNKKIIVFMPKLYPVPPTQKNAIMYEIWTADTEAAICASDKTITNTGINTNPSPPHGGN